MFKKFQKQIFIALAAIFALPLCGHAQNAVKVTPEQGEPTVFLLGLHPKLTLGNSSLNITTDEDATGISFDAAKYHAIEFTSVNPTAVDRLESGEASVRMSGDAIFLNNFEPGAEVSIVNINGMTVRRLSVGSSGDAVVSLSDLPQGIYIFNSHQVKFKFNKK